ncbi:MAG: alkaline phosphatase family protein [Pseudobdellovibrio sp.]
MNKLIYALLLILTPLVTLAAPTKTKKVPTHLVFMVFDQMRPDYIERFHLKNFKRLRNMGTFYKEAYVGDLGSVTVVSHAVMTTGLLPKDLPWSDNILWDHDGKIGAVDQLHSVTNLATAEYLKLLNEIPADKFLINQFKKTTHKKVFAVGEKDYATTIMGGPYSDSIIFAEKTNGQCKPGGLNVPARIASESRFTLECSKTYGTDNSLYPLDGSKFFPGPDAAHLGGDTWVADIALDILKNENDWGGLFLTFGAIDKFGHMLGETDKDTPHAFDTPLHLKDIAQIADEQLGRILDQLEKSNLINETMIVVTADHGGQTNEIFLGNPAAGKEQNFWIQRLSKMAPVRFVSADTGLRIWLKDPTDENIKKSGEVLKELSQVAEVYAIDRTHEPFSYKKIYDNLASQNPKFKKWALEHNQELVNTFANKSSPDLVAVLADDTGFGKLGDHGGFQEKVQRIPLFVVGASFKKTVSFEKMRLVDIKPLISKTFNLE